MTKMQTRWLSGTMTLSAVVAVLVAHATVYPRDIQAAACCQTCEANELACYGACNDASHTDPDAVQACRDSCYYWLYGTYGCWTNCVYCQQDPGSECWSCLVTDHGASPGYAHVLYCWQTGSGFCV